MRFEPNPGVPGAVAREMPADFTTMTAAESDALRDAFATYGILIFRGQRITLDEQFAICGTLGQRVDQSGSGKTHNMMTSHGGSMGGKKLLSFHADYTNAPHGALLTGASLCAIELPDHPTSTVYAHSGLALEELPDDLRARIHGRTAIHSTFIEDKSERPLRHQLHLAVGPKAEHPVEFVHPATGKPTMYISEMNTERIVGLDDAESTELLDRLTEWQRQPRFVYRHTWQVDDLVVWDNLVMQHARDVETTSGTRTLRRVSFTYPAWHDACQEFFDRPEIRAQHGGGAMAGASSR